MNLLMKRRLQLLLEAYGADTARWPAADRKTFEGLSGDLVMLWDEARQTDVLLGLASPPPVPEGSEARLLARIAADRGTSTVVQFAPPPQKSRPSIGWLAALPLAASLALGFYLGAQGTLDSMMPSQVTGTIATVDDTAGDPGDITDLTDYSGGQVS
jgi:hypothetical protein